MICLFEVHCTDFMFSSFPCRIFFIIGNAQIALQISALDPTRSDLPLSHCNWESLVSADGLDLYYYVIANNGISWHRLSVRTYSSENIEPPKGNLNTLEVKIKGEVYNYYLHGIQVEQLAVRLL